MFSIFFQSQKLNVDFIFVPRFSLGKGCREEKDEEFSYVSKISKKIRFNPLGVYIQKDSTILDSEEVKSTW